MKILAPILLAALLTLSVVLILVGCNASEDPDPFLSTGSTEVLRNVYDDQQSTVYIKTDESNVWINGDNAVANIMVKKKEWERQFPKKKVVAISTVTAHDGYPVGLLIHYEQR